ncbi:MAG: M48 family metallopeptidase [Alphaproteobacteria bacterium]|nr:M48 family metallopeptidase [Alphaproteobacteria bacterium SS10]
MQTVGLQTAIWNNNLRSFAMLLMFPVLIYVVLFIVAIVGAQFLGWNELLIDGQRLRIPGPVEVLTDGLPTAFEVLALRVAAGVFALVTIWYIFAFFFQERLVDSFANARPMTRKEFPRAYNLLENLCISRGLPMPKLGLIESGKLNAFASGLTPKTFRITLTSGLMKVLDDEELEAVLAHELSHIINRDVRLMMIAAIFTGILALLAEGFSRSMMRPQRRVRRAAGLSRSRGSSRSSSSGGGGAGAAILAILVVLWVGYLLSVLLRMMISRRREYMADAGAVQLTKKGEPMIRALRKISARSHIADFDDEMRMMLFDNSKRFMGLFSTHPPIDQRVKTIQTQMGIDFDYTPPTRSRRHKELDSGHPNPWRVREMGLGTKGRSKSKAPGQADTGLS